MKNFLVSLLLLVSSIVSAQTVDSYTGNLVYTTSNTSFSNPPPDGWATHIWSGFVGTTSTGQGYSGGNAPGWNANIGTFMFGYNQGTISYTTPVNYALAQAGTGIQVTGLKYSWEYINQEYNRGTLTGNISLTSNTGQTLQSYSYNMPHTTNGWTPFAGTETFATHYAPSSLGNLNVSFTGKDDRWWAGYYGPQVRDINVNLTYAVAAPPPVPTDFLRWIPLANENDTFTLTTAGVVRYGANGTYSYHNYEPGTYSCSNGAWGSDPIGGVYKSCSFGSNTTTTTTTTLPKTTTATTDYSAPLLEPTNTATTAVLEPVTTTTTAATTSTVTDPVVSTTSTTTASTGTVSAGPVVSSSPTSTTTASSSSTTASSSTQNSSKESSGSSSGSTSLALSIISKNSDRDAAGSAVAQSAMAQAQAAATQAQQEASSVASSAASNSLSANAATVGTQQSSGGGIKVGNANSTNFVLQSGLTTLSVSAGPLSTQNTLVQQQGSGGTSTNVLTGQQVSTTNTNVQQTVTTTSTSVVSLLQPQQTLLVSPAMSISVDQQVQQATVQNNNVSFQSTELYSLLPPNMLTDKTNPLTDIIESKQNVPQSNTATVLGPVVNRNAQDSDVAGGVSISKMATSPTGYGDYLNLVLRDVAFYAPKEVYKNQRNVDNERAFRSLGSDRLHQQMVDQQYR